jgi:hypothetical protein
MPRKTLAGQIVELASHGKSSDAEGLARFGRKLSFEESFLRPYYDALDALEAAMKGNLICPPILKGEYGNWSDISRDKFAALTKQLEERKETIASIFIEAVNTHDGERIMNLARAVWFFKDKRHPFPPADRERTLLLFLKGLLDHTGEKLTIRQVAQFLNLEELSAGRKKLETPADGFSALRRKCKELGIPLAESRKTRRK